MNPDDPPQTTPAAPDPVPPEEAKPVITTPVSAASPQAGSGGGRWDQLQRQYQTLEMLFALVVSALILMSLGLNLFLFKQMRLARGQAHAQRDIIGRTSKEFHQNREPIIRNFVISLQEFAVTDPAFRPLLERYQSYLGKYFVPGTPEMAPPASTNSP